MLALLEHHLARCGVEVRTGCTVQTLSQSRGGYVVLFSNADGADESLRADAVVCAMGGSAGPQFGTDGFGPRFAAQCGGALAPLYPCLTALRCAKPDKRLAGIRAKAHAALYSGSTLLADYRGEVQFTDYGLSGICIMDLTRHLTPAVKTLPWSWTSSRTLPRTHFPRCSPPAYPCCRAIRRQTSGWAC